MHGHSNINALTVSMFYCTNHKVAILFRLQKSPKPYVRVEIQTLFPMFDRPLNGSECTKCNAQYICLVKSTRYALPPCTPLIKSLPEWFQLTRCRSGQPFSSTSKLNRPVMQLAPASTTRWCRTPNGIQKLYFLFDWFVSLFPLPTPKSEIKCGFVRWQCSLCWSINFWTTSSIFTKFSMNIGRSKPYILCLKLLITVYYITLIWRWKDSQLHIVVWA